MKRFSVKEVTFKSYSESSVIIQLFRRCRKVKHGTSILYEGRVIT